MTYGDIAISVVILLIGVGCAIGLYLIVSDSLKAKPDRTEFDQDWRGDGRGTE